MKSEELKSRLTRLEMELEKSKILLEKQNERVKNKQRQIVQTRQELVAALMVEKDVSIAELTTFLEERGGNNGATSQNQNSGEN